PVPLHHRQASCPMSRVGPEQAGETGVGRQPPLLELRDVGKCFHRVRVLERVSFAVRAGEVVALVGENGAGKSTLLKAIGGIHPVAEGEIRVDGRLLGFGGVRLAAKEGISLIPQEPSLAGSLSVAENIFLGRQPDRGPRWLPITDRSRMARRAADLLG